MSRRLPAPGAALRQRIGQVASRLPFRRVSSIKGDGLDAAALS
jgi:hypothetical protein